MNTQPQYKILDSDGQISLVLGKELAGKVVSIDKTENGTWTIKSGDFIPDSQKWLYRDGNMEKIERALERVRDMPFEDNFDEFLAKVGMQDV